MDAARTVPTTTNNEMVNAPSPAARRHHQHLQSNTPPTPSSSPPTYPTFPPMAPLLHLLLLLSLPPFSSSQSPPPESAQSPSPPSSQFLPPQNLQTFFPSNSIPAFNSTSPPPSPSPSPSAPTTPSPTWNPALTPTPPTTSPPPSSSSSSSSSIALAVVVTAIISIALSAVVFCIFHRRHRHPPPIPHSTTNSNNKISGGSGNLNGTLADETGLDLVYLQSLDGSGRKLLCSYCKAQLSCDDRSDVDERDRIPEKRGRRKGSRKEKIEQLSLLPSGSVSSSDFHAEAVGSYASPSPRRKPFLSHSRPPRPPSPTFVPHHSRPQPPPPWAPQSPSSSAAASDSHSVPSLPPPSTSRPVSQPPPGWPPKQPFPALQSMPPGSPTPSDEPKASTPPPGVAVQAVTSSASPPPASPSRVPGASAGPGGPPAPPLPMSPGRTSPGAPPPPPAPPGKGGPPPPPPPGLPGKSGPPPPPRLPGKGPPPPPGGISPPGGAGPFRKGQLPPPGRLKPLHWDKMQTGNAGHSMVWDQISDGSFRVDDEDLEAYFGKNTGNQKPAGPAKPAAPVQIVLLDKKRSQNIAIILRSIPVSRSTIVDALLDGNDLSTDTLEKLSNISLARDEEALIRGFSDDPAKLADAESFLFHLLRDVPRDPFARVDALLLRSTFSQELSHAHDFLSTLEAACLELKPDRERRAPGASAGGRTIFVKLLEAVLKAGNKMNQGTSRGNAKAFNLSSLHKLSDVKSSNGKTTLLHFLVKQVVRAEGRRAALNREDAAGGSSTADDASKAESDREHMMLGLPIVGGLSAELANVKRAAMVDHDVLMASLSGLEGRVRKTRGFVSGCGYDGGDFASEMRAFLDDAEGRVKKVMEEKERVMELVRRTTDFYQPGASKDKNVPPLQLFVIVKDFLGMVDKACVVISRNLQEEQIKRKKQEAEAAAAAKLTAGESSSVRSHEMSISDSSTKEEDDGELRSESERISMPRFPNLPLEYLRRISGHLPGDWDDDDDE